MTDIVEISNHALTHSEINGNDQVDKAVRSTINLATQKKFKIPYTDFKMKINKYIL